jgi:hypothetical protein
MEGPVSEIFKLCQTMIRHITQQDVDIKKWDDCIKTDVSGLFYGYSWYLDMLTVTWDALVLDDYQAVMPLVHNRKLGFSYLFRPYGVQQLGVFSKIPQTPQLIQQFIDAIPASYSYVNVFLNVANPVNESMSYKLLANRNFELDLNRSYRTIYEAYSTRTKRNLKKAKQYKHRVFEYDSPDQLITLFRQNRGAQINTLSESNYQTIRQVMYVMLHKRRGYLWTVYNEANTIIAGAFFVETGNRIVLLFSATHEEGRKSHAMTYLLDELFIARAGDQVIFDFEGSNIKGLAEFYGGFGAEETTYYNLIINRLPPCIKWMKKG